MANPLAKQMLNNLARKAGQTADARNHASVKTSQGHLNLDQKEERTLVDLIHLRQKLFPETDRKDRDAPPDLQQPRQGMISLSELAKMK